MDEVDHGSAATLPPPYITENEIRAQLISRATLYCELTGTRPSAFGKAVVNDASFIGRLRKNGNITLSTYSRVQAWIDDNWPKSSAPETPNQQ